MIRQYGGQRRRGGVNPLGVGVIATGSIYYLQDRGFFHDRFGGRAICRNPWIVEGFLNGTCAAARRNRDTGRWEDVTLSGRSDTAVVRSLRDGRQRTVAVRVLELHDDLGLTMQPTIYPSVPDLSLYRRRAASARGIVGTPSVATLPGAPWRPSTVALTQAGGCPLPRPHGPF